MKEYRLEEERHTLRVRDYEDKTVETRIFPKVSMKKDSGIYSCYVTNNHVNSSSFRFALNSHLLL
ncbi:hypothetical protein Anas_11522 [Armadillidium nasatum]|uniref:Immunoglobulin-like beta-sandwich domain-containing protein n=1 Tax=Armadillidium nasatum TaxID=96803 RepID=A0A5N5T381_9CRUS|nr:hypothetical protein Anas_11522 [Armadillidium nasatum]